jgi:geranylgeranyl diphosphate synthase type II
MGCDPLVEFIRLHQEGLQRALADALPRSEVAGAEKFNEALSYAVFPGGKRLRCYLTMIAARLGGSADDPALTLACAIELIHTCSLVLDDLPAMDDGDLRRGRPALHLVFGEGIAILVAMALLNQAYALMGRAADGDRLRQLLAETCRCIGSAGMVGGQAAELALSGVPRGATIPAGLELKTTALMRLALTAGAIAAGSARDDIEALGAFGEMLGGAYQIYDDLADRLGDRQSTGKNVGQDARHVRPGQTQSTLQGDAMTDELIKRAAGMLASAEASLDRFAGRPETVLLQSAGELILAQLNTLVRASSPGRVPVI